LRRSPLAVLFGVAGRVDTPSRLQDILIAAIESLEPAADEPPHSRAWRRYEALFCRYVLQFSQQETADQLGVCTRHVRREQRAALEVLALQLWDQFDLGARLGEDVELETPRARATGDSPILNEELAWLKNSPPDSSANLDEALPAALDLVRPLAAQHGVQLEIRAADGLPNLAVHPVALNQMLLNLLSVAIHRASGGQVQVSVRPQRWEVEIQVQCTEPPSALQPAPNDDNTRLDMARRLAELCGARLALSADKEVFCATLTSPALEQVPVLVIDDNADALRLLERYTAGTRYRLVGTRDPEKALGLAEKLSPQVIVLDVMMPQVDGWKILGRLRQHPLTHAIPILVCTILAQEELALSLGASAFIRKPVTRQAFLAALDGQIERMETESR